MRVLLLLPVLCLSALTICTAADPKPLRQAIRAIESAEPGGYPDAQKFLARLDGWEKAWAESDLVKSGQALADLEQLQREALLAHPLVARHPILFVVRHQYRPDHHNTATFFPGARHEKNDGAFTPGGALKTFEPATGKISTLLAVPDGVIRDPEVNFDGTRILFSMRTNTADSYHIYEMNRDGSGLRQLTFARDVDDLDPLYLADGSIAFSSTREPKYCMCNRHIMANLFRMDADGANIHQIGKSTLFEGHGSLMPDGRILYDRWEYVDRNFGDAQALWTVNPDGTGHAIYWGNNTASPGAVLDPRMIPGTDRAICVFGSCHDRPWGALAIIDRQRALDGKEAVLRTWPADAAHLIRQSGWEIFDAFAGIRLKYEDPYPLDDTFFLCARMTGRGEATGIYLLDLFGNEMLLHGEEPGCFDPLPLGPRPRPAAMPSRRDWAGSAATVYVQNVLEGTHLQGIAPGQVKWLRVVESPEKRFWTGPAWGGQGQAAPAMNWHDFNNKRVLGTVPVHPDGSAYFEVPPDTFVYFQLLDADGMMLQSMRSGVAFQSSERAGCVGCHDERRQAPPGGASLAALRHPPARLQGWNGPAREFSYMAEVQPVLNRRCISCHDYGRPAGKTLNLAPDRDLVFNTSYNELWRKKLIQVPGAGPAEIQPARAWGSHASRLVQTLKNNPRCGGSLTPDEFGRIVTWIDLNAPYYPSYASAYPANLAGRCPLSDAELAELEQLTGTSLRQTAAHNSNPGPLITFERPALSPCLARLQPSAGREHSRAVELIQLGATRLLENPEADAPGFQPCSLDQWRNEKYQARRRMEEHNRAAIREGKKAFDPAL